MKRTLLRLVQALVVTAAAGLVIVRFIAIDAGSHSASDTLRPWLIESGLICLAALAVALALDRLGSRGGH